LHVATGRFGWLWKEPHSLGTKQMSGGGGVVITAVQDYRHGSVHCYQNCFSPFAFSTPWKRRVTWHANGPPLSFDALLAWSLCFRQCPVLVTLPSMAAQCHNVHPLADLAQQGCCCLLFTPVCCLSSSLHLHHLLLYGMLLATLYICVSQQVHVSTVCLELALGSSNTVQQM
jgi:hypothetical protein